VSPSSFLQALDWHSQSTSSCRV